jgi:hypothetical protein
LPPVFSPHSFLFFDFFVISAFVLLQSSVSLPFSFDVHTTDVEFSFSFSRAVFLYFAAICVMPCAKDGTRYASHPHHAPPSHEIAGALRETPLEQTRKRTRRRRRAQRETTALKRERRSGAARTITGAAF